MDQTTNEKYMQEKCTGVTVNYRANVSSYEKRDRLKLSMGGMFRNEKITYNILHEFLNE